MAEAHVPKILVEFKTWRLFIDVPGRTSNLSLITPSVLIQALEEKLSIPLTSCKTVIAVESDRLCVTISLQSTRAVFENYESFDLSIRIPGDHVLKTHITPDDQFFGMTTLYDGCDDSSAIDLIVVPGLSAHPFGSFKSKTRSSDNWLRDYLPESIPNMRVLLYGYDSRLLESESRESITEFAQGLLETVTEYRKDEQTRHRPIILLGHSMGGLVLKEAIVTAMDETTMRPTDEDFFKSCYGLLFFGVPHLGLRHETLLKAVINARPSERLIRDLITDNEASPSPLLQQLANNFRRCYKLQHFEIYSYYETHMSHTINDANGKWERNGEKRLMVTQSSATHAGESNPANSFPLPLDHSGLVKFSRHDAKYRGVVRGHIERMARDAPAVIRARFSQVHELTEVQYHNVRRLDVPSFSVIRDNIADAYPDTFQWLLNDTSFLDWKQSPNTAVMWIWAAPGQGKSVLAGFLTKYLEDCSTGSPKSDVSVVYYFFQGQQEQYNQPESMLRALILQLADCQELYEMHLQQYVNNPYKFWTASFDELWTLFSRLLSDERHQRIYCIIDALDECQGSKLKTRHNKRKVLLSRLIEAFTRTPSRRKLLVTSRPGEKDIEIALQGIGEYHFHPHQEDLLSYIDHRISELSSAAFTSDHKILLRIRLLEKAQRSILWTSLVLDRISYLPFPSNASIEETLRSIPGELNELLDNIVSVLLQTKELALVLIWVAFAKRPLSVQELSDAICLDPEVLSRQGITHLKHLRGHLNSETIHKSLGSLLMVSQRKTGGSSSELKTKEEVLFTHQVVKDFFDRHKGSIFNLCDFVDLDGPEMHLARSCLAYLMVPEIRRAAKAEVEPFARLVRKVRGIKFVPEFLEIFEGECEKLSDREDFRVLQYAGTNWFLHLENREQARKVLDQVKCLLDPKRPLLGLWIRAHWESSQPIFDSVLFLHGLDLGVTLPEIARKFDISWLLQMGLDGEFDFPELSTNDIHNMASKSPRCFDYLCSRSDIPMPEGVFVKAVQSRRGMSSVSSLLLHRAKEVKVTEEVLVAFAMNEKDGQDKALFERMLQTSQRDNSRITSELLEHAASKPGDKLLESLLAWKENLDEEIDNLDKICEIAAANKNLDNMKLLLETFGSQIKISESVLSAATSSGEPMLSYLMAKTGPEFMLTENVMLAAATQDASVIRFLLSVNGADVSLSDKVLATAAGSAHHETFLYLFGSFHERFAVNEDVIAGVASSILHQSDKLKVLLERGDQTLSFSEPVIKKLLSSMLGRKALVYALQWPEEDRCKFVITDAIICLSIDASKEENMWQGVLPSYDRIDLVALITAKASPTPRISDFLVAYAARECGCAEDIRPLLSRTNSDVPISVAILKAAASNTSCGCEMLQFLCTYRGEDGPLDQEVVKAAVSNQRCGEDIVKWLLEEPNKHTEWSEDVVRRIVCNLSGGEKIMRLILDQKTTDVSITEKVLQAVALNWADCLETTLLLSRKHSSHTRVSTSLIAHSDDGHDDFAQKLATEESTRSSQALALMLFSLYDPDYSKRESLLLECIPEFTLPFMSGLYDADVISVEPGSQLRIDTRKLQAAGITINSLLASASCDPTSLQCFLLCVEARIFPWPPPPSTQDPDVDDLDLGQRLVMLFIKAASREDQGRHMVSQLDGNWPAILDHSGARHAVGFAGATSGQTEVLEYLFERRIFDTATKQELVDLASIYNAAGSGDQATVESLIAAGVYPNKRNPFGRTPLWQASVSGHREIAECLLRTGVNVTQRDWRERTPLHWAAAMNQVEVARVLLNYGADTNSCDDQDLTPYLLAQRWSARKTEELLGAMHKRETFEYTSHSGDVWTGLHHAAVAGNEDHLEQLYKQGCPIDAQNQSNKTPLHLACELGHLKIVKRLLDYRCEVNIQDDTGRTALHKATYEGHLDAVLALLDASAEVDVPDSMDLTALQHAIVAGRPDMVQILCEHGANLNRTEPQTPVYLAIVGLLPGILSILIDHGVDVHACNSPTGNYLLDAFDAGMEHQLSVENIKVTRILVTKQVDPDVPDRYGLSFRQWLSIIPGLRSRLKVDLEAAAPERSEAGWICLQQTAICLAEGLLAQRKRGETHSSTACERLGHSLLYMSRPDDAVRVFDLQLEGDDAPAQVECSGCYRSIGSIRHICKTCPLTDLCEDCKANYPIMSLRNGCSEHDFLSIDGSSFSPSEHPDTQTAITEWLETLQGSLLSMET